MPPRHTAESANPLVVTLATPFIEVHPADFGRRPFYIRAAVLGAVWLPLVIFGPVWLPIISTPDKSGFFFLLAFWILAVLSFWLLWWYWLSHRVPARQNKVKALSEATRLGEIVLLQSRRLLVIRALDDEASLGLAVGTIGRSISRQSHNLYSSYSCVAARYYIICGFYTGVVRVDKLDRSLRHSTVVS